MKFGSVSLDDAIGCILAHTYREQDLVLKKGTILSAEDCNSLRISGLDSVIVARLESGDIPENEAASRLGSALSGGGLVAHDAFTGRVNLYSSHSGLFTVSRALVDSINTISSSLTLATLPNDTIVDQSRLVATVKIIPFAVSESLVTSAVDIAISGSAISVYGSVPYRVGLISTTFPFLKPSVLSKTESVLSSRLSFWGSELSHIHRVPHDTVSVSSILSDLVDQVDLVIMFGASAISDISDIIPSSIVRCGGEIEYFGLPVDPGNLLLLGRLRGKYVVGAPGCARSLSQNGFDWILSRILCSAPLGSDYLGSLGVGGLLLDVSSRGSPRE